jgi:hypothetical protein
MTKSKSLQDASGNVSVTLDSRTFTFKKPKGFHLAQIQSQITNIPGITDIESICVLLSVINDNEMTKEDYLNLDADMLLDLSEVVTSNFRLFSGFKK